jgi:hypothetical protein
LANHGFDGYQARKLLLVRSIDSKLIERCYLIWQMGTETN